MTQTFAIAAYSLRNLGLRDARDIDILEAARLEPAIVIITKDSDFVDLVCRLGTPPQIIWLTCGNVTNRNLRSLFTAVFPSAIAQLQQGESIVEISSAP